MTLPGLSGRGPRAGRYTHRVRWTPVVLALGLAACESPTPPVACTAIAVQALNVTVVDAATGRRICDATVVAEEAAFSSTLVPFPDGPECQYSGPTERPGRYDVRVTRAGYQSATRTGVVVSADECHVIPVRLTVELRAGG